MKQRGRRKLLFVIPVLCLWAMMLCVVLEGWARLRYTRGKNRAAHFNTETLGRQTSEVFHPDLWVTEWLEYRPSTSVKYTTLTTNYEVHINNIGFRGPDVIRAHDPDAYTIVCLGGSTTINGRTDDTTYPAFLQAFLNVDSPTRIRVINGGICGLVSSDYPHVLRNVLNGVHPDMVIAYGGINDIWRRMYPHWNEQRGFVATQFLRSRFIKDIFGGWFLPGPHTLRADIDDFIVDNLRAAAATLKERGIRFAVCTFIHPKHEEMSDRQYANFDYNMRHWYQGEYISYEDYCHFVDVYNTALQEAFADTDVMLIPLAETGHYPAEWFVDALHMNTEGIRNKASRIAELLTPALHGILNDEALPNHAAPSVN